MNTNNYSLLFILLWVLLPCLTSAGRPDSLVLEFQHLMNKKEYAEAMEVSQKMGEQYLEKEELILALEAFSKALDLSVKINSLKQQAENLYHLGRIHEKFNNYDRALEYYSQVTEMDEEAIGQTKKLNTYSQMASIYQARGKYDEAYSYQVKALHLHEVAKDTVGMARAHYVIGTIFFYQNQLEPALENYEKSKTLCDILGKQKLIYSCLGALGSVYAKLGDYDKSFKYTKQSLELARKIDYKTGIAYGLSNVAPDLVRQGKVALATEYLEESIRLKGENKDRWGQTGTMQTLAELYFDNKQPEKAFEVLHEAIGLAKEIDSKPRLLGLYETLAQLHEKRNEYKQMALFQKEFIQLKDSVLNETTLEKMSQTKEGYLVLTKEHEINILKKENELFAKNEELQTLYKYLLAGLAGFLGLIAAGIFYGYYTQKQVSQVLATKNAKIELQKEELELAHQKQMATNQELEEKNKLLNSMNEQIHQKNKLLETSNEDLQQFAYVASHDLKEPLRMISSYSNLLKRRYNHTLDEAGKEFLFYITDGVGRMQNLLEELLAYSRVGRKEAPQTWVKMEDVMFLTLSNLRSRIAETQTDIQVNYKELPRAKVDRTQMVQLFQNLISNGIKFVKDRTPKIVVECEQKEDKFIFSIQDNGIGIAEEYKTKIFEMFRRLHSRQEFEGTGIGLATCRKIVARHGGDIWVESEVGEGSTFFFSIPAHQ